MPTPFKSIVRAPRASLQQYLPKVLVLGHTPALWETLGLRGEGSCCPFGVRFSFIFTFDLCHVRGRERYVKASCHLNGAD